MLGSQLNANYISYLNEEEEEKQTPKLNADGSDQYTFQQIVNKRSSFSPERKRKTVNSSYQPGRLSSLLNLNHFLTQYGMKNNIEEQKSEDSCEKSHSSSSLMSEQKTSEIEQERSDKVTNLNINCNNSTANRDFNFSFQNNQMESHKNS